VSTPSVCAARAAVPLSLSIQAGRRAIVRTFTGLTWQRFGILCLLVAVEAVGWTVPHGLALGKSASYITLQGLAKFGGLMTVYMPVLLAVIAVDNWAPTDTRRRISALALAIALGVIAGMLLNGATHALIGPARSIDSEHAVWSASLGAMAGQWLSQCFLAAMATTVYFFVVREDEAHATLHREEMDRLCLEREMTEARLQVMQAQIEPHFLFNTLANVRRLYQTDPPMGRAMLQHLSRYLSAALPQMRESQSTLGKELTLTVAYLNVQKIRMGARLSFDVDVPEALKACALPPMMLLTLVENAIRHGLGPLPEGGRLCVTARTDDRKLRLQVADTGRGLQQSSGVGVGLANIRARLKTLYDSDARLLLAQNPALGVTATLELPVAAPASEAAEAA
jgi:signal transduction histidine kinase